MERRELCLASAWCYVIKISAKTKARVKQWNMSQVLTLMSLYYLTTDTSFVSRSVLWIHECQIEVQHLSFFTLSLSDSLFHGFWWCFSCSLLIHECKMTCVLINIIRHVTQAHGTHLRTAASLAFLFNIRILARHIAFMDQHLKQHPDPRKSRNCRCSLLLLPLPLMFTTLSRENQSHHQPLDACQMRF